MAAGTADLSPYQATLDLDAAYRKVAWRLIPFLVVFRILAWIDRVGIGFAKLQMLGDLKFSETVCGLGAGSLFLGYSFLEVPSNLLLERIGAKKTIAWITIGGGSICIAMMWVTTPVMFYVLAGNTGVVASAARVSGECPAAGAKI